MRETGNQIEPPAMPNRLALPLTKAANVLHKESVQKRQGEREREREQELERERE